MENVEIDEFIAETLVKSYPSFEQRCEICDMSIFNSGTAFSNNMYGGTEHVIDGILQGMNRKNCLINMKLVIDECVLKMPPKHQRELLMLLYYPNVRNQDISTILNIKERSLYRHYELCYKELADLLRCKKYAAVLKNFMKTCDWFWTDLEFVKERRFAFKQKEDEDYADDIV